MEGERRACEDSLLRMEGELRQGARRETQGLLSTKMIQLRKEVEKQREMLRYLEEQRTQVK